LGTWTIINNSSPIVPLSRSPRPTNFHKYTRTHTERELHARNAMQMQTPTHTYVERGWAACVWGAEVGVCCFCFPFLPFPSPSPLHTIYNFFLFFDACWQLQSLPLPASLPPPARTHLHTPRHIRIYIYITHAFLKAC